MDPIILLLGLLALGAGAPAGAEGPTLKNTAQVQMRPEAAALDSTLNLHNHTYCSDGSDTPETLIDIARKAGVRVVAVSDHDTVDCVARAAAAGAKAGVRVVPAIEISAEDDSMHILGLNIDIASPAIEQLVAKNRQARLDRCRETLSKLNTLQAGGRTISLQFKEVLARKLQAKRRAEGKTPPAATLMSEEQMLAEAGPITRPDVALALVDKGYVPDTRAAFDRYLGDDAGAAVELDGPGFAETIRAIHAAGGLAVLAHPHTIYKFKQAPYRFSEKAYRDFDALLDDMLAAGLDGIEQYKARFGPAGFIVARVRSFSASSGRTILMTPGSDYHGSSGVGNPYFDAIAIPRAEAARILEALDHGARPMAPAPSVMAGQRHSIEAAIPRLDSIRFDR